MSTKIVIKIIYTKPHKVLFSFIYDLIKGYGCNRYKEESGSKAL